MNQNLAPAYFHAGSKSTTPQHVQTSSPGQMTVQPTDSTTFSQPSSGTPFNSTSSAPVFHSSTTGFLPNSNIELQPASIATSSQPPQQMRFVQAINPSTLSSPVTTCQQGAAVPAVVTAQNANETTMQILQPQTHGESDEKRTAALLDSYLVEQQAPTTSGVVPMTTYSTIMTTNPSSSSSFPSPANIVAKNTSKNKAVTPGKREKDEAKRAKLAEAARLRYHRLSSDEKRELNGKRALAQKKKRQREKEMEELEELLRQTNDIQEISDDMTFEESRPLDSVHIADKQKDEHVIRSHKKDQNAKRAETARLRYHRMSDDEKRAHKQRRAEAFRRSRMEEEMFLAMPIGRVNGEAMNRAQQIVVRNAKRAEAARLRYQRMTPDQRKAYNQKRYTPKRKIESTDSDLNGSRNARKEAQDEVNALATLERDVIKYSTVPSAARSPSATTTTILSERITKTATATAICQSASGK